MAQKTVVTTPDVAANSGQGTPLATAFEWINDNFDEVYAKPDLTLAANILTLTKPDGTTDTVDLSSYLDEDARAIASGTINGSGIVTFTRDDASTFTLDLSSLLDGGVTSVNTQTGAVVLDSDDISEGSTNLYNQTHTGDVTGSTALTIANDVIDSQHYVDGSIDTAHIADDQITHAKLEGRYTDYLEVTTSGSGTINLDASQDAAFNLSGALGTITLNVNNMKTGQVIDILLSGDLSSAVITLGDNFATSTISKVGTNNIDTTKGNIIQVLCIDDTDSAAILTWAVATYETDDTLA